MSVPNGVDPLQVNRWLFLKAPDGSQTLPTYDCIPPSADSSFISDGATLINTIDDNYYGMLRCGVSFDANTTWTTTITHDDGCQIYVDRVSVYANSYYAPNTSISIPFTAGVHTVDILWSEQTGGDGIFDLSAPLSTVAQGMWALLSAGGGAIPVINARDDVTLASITDVSYTRRYYLLQSSTLNPPAAPTVNPAPAPWVTTEPSYDGTTTNTLYTVDLTVFSDGTFDYSTVSKSSSYEAAKAAWNKADTAQSAANTALNTANGKNKIIRSTSAASGTSGYVAGDQWWQYSGTQIIAMWIYSGSAWVAQTLTDSVITNLNAGTITAGTINADRIGAASITGGKIAGSTITASNMVAGTITAASGIIANATIGDAQIINGSITNASIKDATIQSAKIAALDAGKITTGYLGADRIAAGSLTAAKLATGTITASSGVIADLAITDAKIANGTISNAKIANLDAGKITTGTISAARISANSITADKLNANVFNAQTITGSVLTAGGGSLPQVLVGPKSGSPGVGDAYGVYLTTPNSNAQGSASLQVTPTGPALSFTNSSDTETFFVDGSGNIRIVNKTDGGVVDLSNLVTQKWSWRGMEGAAIPFSSGGVWRAWEFLTSTLFKVNSPTGRLRLQTQIMFPDTTIGNGQMRVQLGLYTQDPSSQSTADIFSNLYTGKGYAETFAAPSNFRYYSVGGDIVDVTPNTNYWVRPIWTSMVMGSVETKNLDYAWALVEPC